MMQQDKNLCSHSNHYRTHYKNKLKTNKINKMKIENLIGYLMIVSLFVALFVTISVVSGITIALDVFGLTFITFAFIVLAVYLMEK